MRACYCSGEGFACFLSIPSPPDHAPSVPLRLFLLVPWALLACAPPGDVRRSRTADSAASAVASAEVSPVEDVDRLAFAGLADGPGIRAVMVPSTTLDTLSILHCPSIDLGAQPAVAAGARLFHDDTSGGGLGGLPCPCGRPPLQSCEVCARMINRLPAVAASPHLGEVS